MGVLARGFCSSELDKNLQENIDEIHFIMNMDDKRTLGFRNDTKVKYAYMVLGGIGIAMVVKVIGGPMPRLGLHF